MDENSMIDEGVIFAFPGRRWSLVRDSFLAEEEIGPSLVAAVASLIDLALLPSSVEAELGRDDHGRTIHAQIRTPAGAATAMYVRPDADEVPAIDGPAFRNWIEGRAHADTITIRSGMYVVDAPPGSVLRCVGEHGCRDVPTFDVDGRVVVDAGLQGGFIEAPFVLRCNRDDQVIDVDIFWSHWTVGCGAGPLRRWIAACEDQGWRLVVDPRQTTPP